VQYGKLKRPEPSEYRKFWNLAPDTVFLNHGSFGACPRPILDLQSELRARMEAEPVQFLWRRYEELLNPSRDELARFIGANARDLVFVTNATTAINSVVRSLRLGPGDEVLTTNHDYNACRNVLAKATHRTGAKLVVANIPFPIHGEEAVIEAVVGAVTKRTRLAMIDHVTSNTALVLPLEKIVKELQSRGVETLVDGAHATGMIPLNLNTLGATYYTGNLHKWVCAPKGAAFLWVREDRQDEIQPAVISHGNNRPRPGQSPFQDRFDWAGSFDPTAWFCTGEAIRWLGQLLPGGWTELRERNRALAIEARRILCSRLQLHPPAPESMLGSMAALSLPERFQGVPRGGRIDAEQQKLYDEFGIEVPWNRFGDPERRWFRISAQIYNTAADYEYLADAMQLL
jgi:isopenicillin-N epimerase